MGPWRLPSRTASGSTTRTLELARRASSATSTATGIFDTSQFISSANSHFNTSGTSILIAWGFTALASLVIILFYSRWRVVKKPDYELIYIPRVKACEKKQRLRKDKITLGESVEGTWCPPVPAWDERFFGWLKPAWEDFKVDIQFTGRSAAQKARNERLLNELGLDAFTYIQFLRLLRWLFVTLSFVVAFPLMAANYLINTDTSFSDYLSSSNSTSTTSASASTTSSSSSSNNENTLLLQGIQLLTAADIKGNALLVHIGFEGIATCIVGVFFMQQLWRHGASVERWAAKNYAEVAFKTILLTKLAVSEHAPAAGANAVTRHLPRGRAPRTAASAQTVIRSRLSYGGPLTANRSNVWFPLNDVGKLCDESEEYSKEEFAKVNTLFYMHQVHTGNTPTPSLFDGFWAKLLRRHSQIEHAVQKALARKQQLEKARKEILGGEPRGKSEKMLNPDAKLKRGIDHAFVSVAEVDKAQSLIAGRNKANAKRVLSGVHVELAPRPKTIIWKNLERSEKSKLVHLWIGRAVFGVILILNCIPLMIIQWLANPQPLIEAWPWLQSKVSENNMYMTILEAFSGAMSASVSGVFYLLLPYAMRRLSKWSGALYRGQLDKDVIRGLFNFLLISNFVIFSLLGVLYDAYTTVNSQLGNDANATIWDYLDSMSKVPAEISNTYISESSYWLSWFPVHAAVYVFNLLQLPSWAMQIYNLYVRGVETPQAWEEACQPETFEYAIEYSHHLFAMVVGLVYAPLAPLVTVCCTVYFWTASIVHTHQLTYVQDTKETDGQAWNVVMNRVLVGLAFMQLLMLLTVVLKTTAVALSVAAALPLILTMIFTYLVRVHRPKQTAIHTRAVTKSEAAANPGYSAEVPNYLPEFLGPDWHPELTIVSSEKVKRLLSSWQAVKWTQGAEIISLADALAMLDPTFLTRLQDRLRGRKGSS